MYTRILVPLDGSAFSERALSPARTLARRFGATLDLVHVHEAPPLLGQAPMYDTQYDAEVRRQMHDGHAALAARIVQEGGVTATATFLDGKVVPALRQHAADTGADLIVMTSHGRGGISRAWLGSVADRLIREVDAPVFLVPTKEAYDAAAALTFRRVLVPLDSSDLAEGILDHALAVGTPGETEYHLLTIVSAWPPGNLYPSVTPPVGRRNIERFTGQARRDAEQSLALVVALLGARGVRAHAHVIVSAEQPAQAILDFIAQHDVDVVALATRARSGIGRAILGSVADKVLRAAQVPVLVYHAPTAEESTTPAKDRATAGGAVGAPHD